MMAWCYSKSHILLKQPIIPGTTQGGYKFIVIKEMIIFGQPLMLGGVQKWQA